EAVALGVQALREPRRGGLDRAVLLEAPGQLLGGLVRRELGEVHLLLGEELARLQLEQRRDQDEELADRVEVEPLLLREALAERDDDRGDVDLRRPQLVFQDERQQQVERALERVEIELELPKLHEAGG